ncbi:MAG: transcription elongation factor GreA [Patescibacteria group bacterium]|nr:transcription elongation factor GreA [Patescibacteria group bacterium]
MSSEPTYITKEGLKKFKKELDNLKNVKRKEIANRIQEAKEMGDLSENAEYAEAKNEQSFVEGRIVELKEILKNASIIDKKNNKGDRVNLGSTIKVKNDDKISTFIIVGTNEVNLEEGKISHKSPIGQAFLGCKKGETIKIEVPSGVKEYQIISIE